MICVSAFTMVFDRKTLMIPDKTLFEDRVIRTAGDVVVGDRSLVQFGIKTDGRIFVGEHVIIDGDLDATDDVRIDIFSSIGGDIRSGGNTFLGEKVKVKGRLSLEGDLDVGDSVEIENGFEARGWINIRSPIPMVIYIFIYLMQLLKLGRSEEIERILQELEDNDGETIPISESFLFIPNSSIIGSQKSRVDCNLHVGKECRVLGNFDIRGNIFVEEGSNIFGTLKSAGDVYCGKKVNIEGNIFADGIVNIDEYVHVAGDVSADKIFLSKTASIDGTLLAKEGISFIEPSQQRMNNKIKRFAADIDVVDEVEEILK